MTLASSQTPRRRRADAERSRAAILDAATRLLGERPDAGVEAIAGAAGVTRQTVYAHFPSRADLIAAVVGQLTEQTVTALDAADLDEGPATAAVLRLLDVSWQTFDRYPVLLQLGSDPVTPQQDHDRHTPVTQRLTRLIRRGQQVGEFDPRLAPLWLVAAIIALGHAAGAEVAAGRMSSRRAAAALRTSVLRVLGATDPR